MSRKSNKKKRKLNKKRFFTFIFVFFLVIFSIYKILNTNIENIYISGNSFYSDQKIIDISGISDYPNSIKNNFYVIKNKLESDKYILKATIHKKSFLSKVYIKVEENYPLFYYLPLEKTILYDGTKIEDKYSIPTLINKLPDTIYEKFLSRMRQVDVQILNRISEIEYKPNDVDEKRFLITMNDGNYVYISLNKFLTINKYYDILKSFSNKKGILHLDSGEYFEVFK